VGTLYLVATPIGNLEDITLRALRVLGEVDAIACEDTRMTRKIFDRHDVSRPSTIFSHHEHNEERAGGRILGLLKEGVDVAVCTDGGYPGISDPGYRIVSRAIEEGYSIEVLPGASAVTCALVSSGLPTSSYVFKGFPPRKEGPRVRFLEQEAEAAHTIVLFESPHRTGKLLKSALAALGDRRAAVCLELTKKFEEIHRGYLSELSEHFAELKIRGEVTVVIAGNHPKFIRVPSEETDSDSE